MAKNELKLSGIDNDAEADLISLKDGGSITANVTVKYPDDVNKQWKKTDVAATDLVFQEVNGKYPGLLRVDVYMGAGAINLTNDAGNTTDATFTIMNSKNEGTVISQILPPLEGGFASYVFVLPAGSANEYQIFSRNGNASTAPTFGTVAVDQPSLVVVGPGDGGYSKTNMGGGVFRSRYNGILDVPDNGLLILARSYRSSNINAPSTNAEVGGGAISFVESIETTVDAFPNYFDVFMARKADLPANNSGINFDIFGPQSNDLSDRIFIFVIEQAEQALITTPDVVKFEAGNVASNQLDFSSLATTGYLLLDFCVSSDPDEAHPITGGTGQTRFAFVDDQEIITSYISYKAGNTATNSMQALNLQNKAVHMGFAINAVEF